MDRPTLQLKWFQEHFEKAESAVEQLRADTIVNYILHLEQELTVRDELITAVYHRAIKRDSEFGMLLLPDETYDKLRDFIKRKEG